MPSSSRKCRVLPLLFAFISAIPLSAAISPEAGAFFSQQYRPEIYGASPQNWAIVQNHEGIMFFGNTDGLLEYDGATWRKIGLTNGSTARSLAVDASGTVYVGGQNEFGYLKADATGTLQYVSLLDKLPANERSFGDIWTVNATQEGVFFSSYRALFRWSPDHKMKVWKPISAFGNLVVEKEVPYIVSQGSGLMRLEGNNLKPVPNGEMFASPGSLVSVFSFAGSLVFAKPDGLYHYEGNKFKRFVTDVDNLLRDLRLYTCKVLKNGDVALGTAKGGLVLIDSAGHLERTINKSGGLPSNAVNSIYIDRDYGVWLALSRGLMRLNTELPLTQFGDREGLDEIANVVERYEGTIYTGTGVGLNQLVKLPGATPSFVPIEGISGSVQALLSTKEALFVGSQRGIHMVKNGQAHVILNNNNDVIFDLASSSHDPNMLYAAGRHGLFVLRFDGATWEPTLAVPSEGQPFRTVIEEEDGRLWVTTRTRVLRVDLTDTPAKVERYGKAQGISAGWNSVFHIHGQTIFATAKGILRFDEKAQRFTPYEGFGKEFSDGSHPVLLVRENPNGDIWISGDTYHGVLHPTNSNNYRWDENPLVLSGIKELYALYSDSDQVVWASGSNGGLIRYEMADTALPVQELKPSVRAIQLLRADQTLFGGSSDVLKDGLKNIRIKYQQNSVRFRYAAPVFEDELRTQYQVKLQGLDRKWSDWSAETNKEYTNLGIGHYVFQVRARDVRGRIGQSGSFAFRILAPWYRSWWAYILYAFGAMGAVWLIIRWRVLALAESNRKLENIILERTNEIREQRDAIEEQRDAIEVQEKKTESLLLNILPRSVADELRSTGSVLPTAYEDITICFTDFVGFTLSSEKVPASDLVAGLHRYFTAFDEIITRYGLEKMKTIGDSYMFVSGLPKRSPSHAVDAVMAAIEIADAVVGLSETSPNWKVRIGLHSGPVIAGVVGVQKFAYDIWGETVNFASRFESSGKPNRVNISARTYELVRDFIECEPRGLVKIKEGRLLEMYFAGGVRSELLSDDDSGEQSAFAKQYRERFGFAPAVVPSLKPALSMAQQAGRP